MRYDFQIKCDLQDLDLRNEEIRKRLLSVLNYWTFLIEREVKQGAPVDTGISRAQILGEIIERTHDIIARVGSGKRQSFFQELGTRPHYVSAQKMKGWIKRHGLEDKLLYKKGIWVGPKGNKHFVPFDIAPSLLEWAKAHNALERKAVKVSGKAQPHFEPVFNKYRDQIIVDLNRKLEGI